jgi:adenylate cyclase
MTDRVVLPLPFSDGTNKALSVATARSGGFSDDELTLFMMMTPAVASHLEIQALRRMARTLLDTPADGGGPFILSVHGCFRRVPPF